MLPPKRMIEDGKTAGDKPPPYDVKTNAKALLTFTYQKFSVYLTGGRKTFSMPKNEVGRRGTVVDGG